MATRNSTPAFVNDAQPYIGILTVALLTVMVAVMMATLVVV